MKLATHILRKDFRENWLWVALVLISAVGFTWTQTAVANTPLPSRNVILALVGAFGLAWATTCAFFVFRLVHADRLDGDTQYWLARPLEWRHLFAAKFAAITLVVVTPLFCCGLAELITAEIFSASLLPGLLWHMVVVSAFWIIPAWLLAALTRNTAQAALGLITTFLAAVVLNMLLGARGGGITGQQTSWIPLGAAFVVAITAGPAILLSQYAARQTRRARIAYAAAAILLFATLSLIPTRALHATNHRLSKVELTSQQPTFTLDSARPYPEAPRGMFRYSNYRAIPLAPSGLPDGWRIEGLGHAHVESGGEVMHPLPYTVTYLQRTAGSYWLTVPMRNDFHDRRRESETTIRANLQLTIYGNPRQYKIPASNGQILIDGVGRCTSTFVETPLLSCAGPFEIKPMVEAFLDTPGMPQVLRHEGSLAPIRFSPEPGVVQRLRANLFQGPVSSTQADRAKDLIIHVMDPIGSAARTIELKGIRLAEYSQPADDR
ncbi:MAG: hypothetical protein JNL98_33285 [Bryobacterales bacterium]|nr:hypothetical protein [Bryobacterales bacterium]